jgi:hypothetical protein
MNFFGLDSKETKLMVQQIVSDMSSQDIPTVTRNQWRHDLRNWLSSPDPSTNHIILCGAQHQGTSQWFFRGNLFEVWKTSGSLLWVHGKRTSPNPGPSLFHSLMTCLYSGFRKERPLVRCFSYIYVSGNLSYMLALRSSKIS